MMEVFIKYFCFWNPWWSWIAFAQSQPIISKAHSILEGTFLFFLAFLRNGLFCDNLLAILLFSWSFLPAITDFIKSTADVFDSTGFEASVNTVVEMHLFDIFCRVTFWASNWLSSERFFFRNLLLSATSWISLCLGLNTNQVKEDTSVRNTGKRENTFLQH